ncbi:MAG: nucleotidyltransferase family protein [Candidatus Marinimicrobia bacterium]|nr:nucleotidyltransferase family protein [Candidatus Neomarinimicrobiota bacterium]
MNISMIIPAAGMSSRHIFNKLLQPTDDSTVIESTINSYLNHKFDIIVITGFESDKLLSVIPTFTKDKINIYHNANFEAGYSTSIKLGVKSARNNCDYFGFGLGDKPFIQHDTIQLIVNILTKNRPGILIPTFDGIPGHPSFFSKDYYNDFMQISGDSGGKELLNAYPNDVMYFPVNDRGIILDMDMYYKQNES